MVRGKIENGLDDADCKDCNGDESGDGQVFDAAAFHGGHLRADGNGSQKKNKNIFRNGEKA